jgi:hypothetical protein
MHQMSDFLFIGPFEHFWLATVSITTHQRNPRSFSKIRTKIRPHNISNSCLSLGFAIAVMSSLKTQFFQPHFQSLPHQSP